VSSIDTTYVKAALDKVLEEQAVADAMGLVVDAGGGPVCVVGKCML
jgi:hypothetical protein